MHPPSQSIEAHSAPWNRRSFRTQRDSTQHLLPVVKMAQHQRCFCQVWEVEAGGYRWLFPARLCRIPYPKYMRNPNREIREWEGKVGSLFIYRGPRSLLLRQFGGVQLGFSHSSGVFIPENHLPITFQTQTGPFINHLSGPRGHLHHQINVQKDAHQREDRQSRDLWAESGHLSTQPRRLKGRPDPTWVGHIQSNSGCMFSAYWDCKVLTVGQGRVHLF